MKKITLLLFVLSVQILYSQAIQKGRVFEKDSDRNPLSDAYIVVNNAPPATSGTDGKYRLVFEKKQYGEMVFVDSISKKGYEIVNEREINNWILSDKKDFNIILCKKGLLKRSREEYYKIGKSRYEKEYNKKREEIEELKKQNKLSESEYNKKLSEIYEERKKAVELLDHYADVFSRINKDDLSEIEKRAFVHTEKGEIDEAIKIYEDEKLYEKFTSNDSLKQQLNEELESMIPSLKRYAELCTFAGGKENYDKAERCYEAIVLQDTTSIENIGIYIQFLMESMKFNKTKMCANNLMNLSKNKTGLEGVFITGLTAYAYSDYVMQNYQTAESNLNEALNIILDSTEKFSKQYKEPLLILIYSALAQIKINLCRLNEAEEYSDKSLSLLKKSDLENDTQLLSEYVWMQFIKSDILLNNYELDSAEKNLNDVLNITREMVNKQNYQFYSLLGMNLVYMSKLFLLRQDYSKAEELGKEALEIIKDAPLNGPPIFLCTYAINKCIIAQLQNQKNNEGDNKTEFEESLKILDNISKECSPLINMVKMGVLYFYAESAKKNRNFSKADSLYTQSLYLIDDQRNDFSYLLTLNDTYIGLANLQCERNEFVKAEENYLRSLTILDSLFTVNESKIALLKAETLGRLGFLKQKKKEYTEAEIYFREGLKVLTKCSQPHNEQILSKIARVHFLIGALYYEKKEFELAKAELLESYSKYNALSNSSKKKYAIDLADVHTHLGLINICDQEYIVAEDNFKRALILYKENESNCNEDYFFKKGCILNNIINVQFEMEQFDEAKNSLHEIIGVLENLLQYNKKYYKPELAGNYMLLAKLNLNSNELLLTEKNYKTAIQLYKEIINEDGSNFIENYFEALLTLSAFYIDYIPDTIDIKYYKNCRENINEIENILEKDININSEDKQLLGSIYGNMSYDELLFKEFNEAITSAKKALQLDSTQIWIYTNLAHAYLLSGEYEKAREIYIKYKNEVMNETGKTFKEACIEDFNALEEKGITHPDIEKIKKLLTEN